MNSSKIYVFLLLCFVSINIFADGTSTTIVINAPQFIQTGPSDNSIDYTICGYPKICNAGTNTPYTTKPITLAPTSSPITPDWQNAQWQCNPSTCMNTTIRSSSPSGLAIDNNIIYATLGTDNAAAGTKAARVLQMTNPIPAGWTCTITTDPTSNKPVASCSTSKKLLWNCQPNNINCSVTGCSGMYCTYSCDALSVNKNSYLAGTTTPINSYTPTPANFGGWVSYDIGPGPQLPSYSLTNVSYSSGQIICNYQGNTAAYTINGSNCVVDATNQNIICDWQ